MSQTKTVKLETSCGKGCRKVHLDFLRIIAIFLVLFNHTSTRGFVLFTVSRESPFYWFYLSFSVLDKTGVPLFLMISGALLLSRQESIRQVFKRISRIAAALLLCSAVGYLFRIRHDFSQFSFSYFVEVLFSRGHTTASWYLYGYLSFLLVLPFLQKLAKSLDNREFIYLIGIFLVFKLLSIVEYFSGVVHESHFQLLLGSQFIVYPLFGYYMEERFPSKYLTWKSLCCMTGFSIFALSICCLLTNYYCTLNNAWTEDKCQKFINTLNVFPAITVFGGVKMLFAKVRMSAKLTNLIITAGNCTFGIYLFEQIFRSCTVWFYDALYPVVHSFPACILWILFALTLGSVVTLILKRIPVLRKIL